MIDRYFTKDMKRIWSDHNRFKTWEKVEIAVAKGKKLYDKRQVKKTRDWNREKARLLSKNNK